MVFALSDAQLTAPMDAVTSLARPGGNIPLCQLYRRLSMHGKGPAGPWGSPRTTMTDGIV